MDKKVVEQERTLERLSVEDEVEEKRLSIAQKKHIEKQLKKEEGSGWRAILGVVGKIKINSETVQTLHSQGHDLRELSKPRNFRRGL